MQRVEIYAGEPKRFGKSLVWREYASHVREPYVAEFLPDLEGEPRAYMLQGSDAHCGSVLFSQPNQSQLFLAERPGTLAMIADNSPLNLVSHALTLLNSQKLSELGIDIEESFWKGASRNEQEELVNTLFGHFSEDQRNKGCEVMIDWLYDAWNNRSIS